MLLPLFKKCRAGSACGCVALATGMGIVSIFFLLLIMALILSRLPAPLSIMKPSGLLIGCLGAAASGFVCSRIKREKGFFYGLGCGALLFVILFLVSLFSWRMRFEPYTFIKLFSMMLCAALGGSIGVNWR